MKKTKNTFIMNLLIIFSAIVFFIVVIAGNVGVAKSNVAVIPGSYGEKYLSVLSKIFSEE